MKQIGKKKISTPLKCNMDDIELLLVRFGNFLKTAILHFK